MAKTIELLSESRVKTLKKPGKYRDGGNGLYLRIVETAGGDLAKSWVFRYRFPPRAKGGGKQRDLGLGSVAKLDLEHARSTVREYWSMIEHGTDPMSHRQAAAASHASKHTYKQAAETYIAAKRAGWHPRHTKAWERGLKKYCKPIAALPVDAITADDVAKCLRDDWLAKPETTDRLRQQIERVLDAAAADGKRSRENPARWKGSMEAKLPDRPRGRKSRPRAAFDPPWDAWNAADRLAAVACVCPLALMGGMHVRDLLSRLSGRALKDVRCHHVSSEVRGPWSGGPGAPPQPGGAGPASRRRSRPASRRRSRPASAAPRRCFPDER